MAHTLKIGVEAALGLDIRVAHKIANLGLFAAKNAFLAHTFLRICKKTVHFKCGKNKALAERTALHVGITARKRRIAYAAWKCKKFSQKPAA